ncbi:MAG TPA: thioredoxin [Bacteroidales bacterium]|nr:thioredoxin [Bacteroidales bacterium]
MKINTLIILGTMMFLMTSARAIVPEGAKPESISASSTTAIIHLNDAMFKEMVFDYEKNDKWKYEGNKPAIIDFYADWCAPCRQLAPVIEDISKEYSGKIVVYKVDTEKEKKLAQKIGITALPTLIFIPVNGQPQVVMGAVPKSSLVKAINDVLKVK